MFTHGFSFTTFSDSQKTLFVRGEIHMAACWCSGTTSPAWMERYRGQQDVLLLDWTRLAWYSQVWLPALGYLHLGTCTWVPALLSLQVHTWSEFGYDLAAHQAIDVGEFLGRCLAGLSTQ